MKILPEKSLLAASIAALALSRPAPAQAYSPYLVVPDPAVAEASPAYRYANMSDAEALAELDRRKIVYTKLDAVPGVRAPIRLTARLHGVYIHSSLPPDQRVTTMFEILDARLALSLDDFAAILERHDIDEVVHFTMYRPNLPAPSHGVQDEPVAGGAAIRPRSSSGGAHPAPGAILEPSAPKAAPPKAAPALGAKGELEGPKSAAAAPALAKQKLGDPAPKPALTVTAKKGAPKLPAASTPPRAQPKTLAAGAPIAAAPKPAGSVTPTAAPKAPAGSVTPTAAPKASADSVTPTAALKASADSVTPMAAPKAPAGSVTLAVAPKAPAGSVTLAGAPTRTPGVMSGRRPTSPIARREPQASGLHQTTWAPPGTRHPAGLAIDVGLLHRRDGRWLSVANQFHGHIGDKTCGEGARVPESPDARELRALVCEASDLGVFTYVLTPDYNAAHADHFHMEIKPGVRWFLYH